MYLFIYLLVSVWTQGYLFYSITIIIYFVAKIVPDLTIRRSFELTAVSFRSFIQPYIMFFLLLNFWYLEIFYAHFILALPSPGSSYFSKELCFFSGEQHLEAKILEGRYTHSTLVLYLLRAQNQKIYMYIHMYFLVFICISIYLSKSLNLSKKLTPSYLVVVQLLSRV